MLTFDDLAVATGRVCEAAKEHVLTASPPWPSSSEAARDARQERRFPAPLADHPVQDAISRALLSLNHAAEHLSSMGHLINAPLATLSVVTLSRTVASASARAYWLLEPGVGPNERVRRAVNVRLESLAEQQRVSHGVAQWSQQSAELAARRDGIISAATEHGFEVQEANRAVAGVRLWFIPPAIPSEMTLVNAIDFLAHGFDPAVTHYRLASASVHAQSHTLGMLTRTRAGSTHEGITRMETGISLASMATLSSPAVWAFFSTSVRTLQLTGGADGAFRAAAAPGLAVWRQALRESTREPVPMCEVELR